MGGVLIPFALAAIFLAACALRMKQGTCREKDRCERERDQDTAHPVGTAAEYLGHQACDRGQAAREPECPGHALFAWRCRRGGHGGLVYAAGLTHRGACARRPRAPSGAEGAL